MSDTTTPFSSSDDAAREGTETETTEEAPDVEVEEVLVDADAELTNDAIESSQRIGE